MTTTPSPAVRYAESMLLATGAIPHPADTAAVAVQLVKQLESLAEAFGDPRALVEREWDRDKGTLTVWLQGKGGQSPRFRCWVLMSGLAPQLQWERCT